MTADTVAEWDEPYPFDRCVHCGHDPLDSPDGQQWRRCSECGYSIGPSHVTVEES